MLIEFEERKVYDGILKFANPELEHDKLVKAYGWRKEPRQSVPYIHRAKFWQICTMWTSQGYSMPEDDSDSG